MTLVLSLDENSLRFKSLVVAIVVLLHLVFYQVISYNQRPSLLTTLDLEENGLRIQYVESVRHLTNRAPSALENKSALPAAKSSLPEARKDLAVTTLEGSKPVQAAVLTSTEGARSFSNGPLVLEWTDNTKIKPDYRQKILDDRIPHSLSMSEPDRFRMRKQISGKDVIEGTAQFLGLWPPGYTTDPCPKIKRNIGGLMSDTRPVARELLNEELRRQQAYCR